MSKRIPLTQDKFAIIDDADFDWLSQWKWCATKHSRSIYYAVRTIGLLGKQTTIAMHRLIMNPPPGLEPDHINGDGLDNRRCNLRLCTHAQNIANSKKRRGSSSRYKGVSWAVKMRKWRARICSNGESLELGYFDDESIAACAYNAAAVEHFGEFALLNLGVGDG